MTAESVETLLARIDAAVRARARLRGRPLDATIAALVAAADRWRDDAVLVRAVAEAARLSPPVVTAGLRFAADAIDAAALRSLVEAEWGPGAARRPVPEGPALVAHVLASNVPALALPAIALGCLAGAAVVVKSGRRDPVSAPAFARTLAAVDPDLAATVVATYWPGGDVAREEVVLRRADVAIVTGGTSALGALGARLGRGLVAHGPRASAAVVGRAADVDAAAEALALDVAIHDQRGCLSPHAVWVEGDARGFARTLARALDATAIAFPLGPADVEERAAARVFAAEAEWRPGMEVFGGVVYEEADVFRPTPGLRTVRVHPLGRIDDFPTRLAPGAVECLAVAGLDPVLLAPELRARGVSRVCRPGRMQRPSIRWPRGQRAPLGVLLGRAHEPQLEIEP
ncbi:MAG TPA: acyl-CoA reductase [Candidatus Binatia bacterium]|nr:acyl-CoA reductase [Candidatus Binatia bacterium]